MYHSLLTNRYLTSRVIPLVAVGAVALCVTLVIVVVSVMTGFLDMVRSSGRTLTGDVIVAYPISGIPYYERLIDRLEALPEAAAATPVIDAWGLLKMPYPQGPYKDSRTVQIWGIEPEGFARVTGYADLLYWRPYPAEELAEMKGDDPRLFINEEPAGAGPTLGELLHDAGLTLHDARSGGPGIVLGIRVSIANERADDGSVRPTRHGDWWMPSHDVTVTLIPVAAEGGVLQPESIRLPVVNEFESGVFLIDEVRAMIPLEIAQERLHLNAAEVVDESTLDEDGLPVVIGTDPAKATQVLVRAAEGVTPDVLRDAVERAYQAFSREIEADAEAIVKAPRGVSIKTWVQQQARFIGPIEKERELMRFLFSLVSLIAAGLVLAIFWAIVYEKTRDIGILRSMGASRFGISWIFLRYGVVIGVVGAIVGLGLAHVVVRNINPIHTALGEPPRTLGFFMLTLALGVLVISAWAGRHGRLFPIAAGSLGTIALAGLGTLILVVRHYGGIVIWDPEVYIFSEIPNDVDNAAAIFAMIGAVVASVIGAYLPAARAADTDPVQALRYE